MQGYINAEEAEANDPKHKSNRNKGVESCSILGKQDNRKWRDGGNGDKQVATTSNQTEVKKSRQEEN